MYIHVYCQESQDILLQTSLWCFAFTKFSDNIIEILRFQYIWFYAHDNHSCSMRLQSSFLINLSFQKEHSPVQFVTIIGRNILDTISTFGKVDIRSSFLIIE